MSHNDDEEMRERDDYRHARARRSAPRAEMMVARMPSVPRRRAGRMLFTASQPPLATGRRFDIIATRTGRSAGYRPTVS